MLSDKPIIIFVHIPKCAGTSIRNLFNRIYDTDKIYDPFDQPDFENSTKGDFDRFDVLFGHRHYGAHEKLTRPYRYVTFLRNPVTRLFSNWQYIRTHKTHRDYEKAVKCSTALDFYSSGGEPWGANGMAKMLAGFDPRYINLNDRKLGIQATRNLRNFYFVGTSELMELSLVCLRQKLGWNTIPFCPTKHNASKYTTKLGLDEKIKLSEYCKEDLELALDVLSTFEKCPPALIEEAKDLAAVHKVAVSVMSPLRGNMRRVRSLNDWAKKAVELCTVHDETYDRAKAYVDTFEAGL